MVDSSWVYLRAEENRTPKGFSFLSFLSGPQNGILGENLSSGLSFAVHMPTQLLKKKQRRAQPQEGQRAGFWSWLRHQVTPGSFLGLGVPISTGSLLWKLWSVRVKGR